MVFPRSLSRPVGKVIKGDLLALSVNFHKVVLPL